MPRPAATSASPTAALSVKKDPVHSTPRLCLGNELLLPLMPGQQRPAAETRALVKATAELGFFREMRAELRGDWPQAHAELCAQMQPVLVEPGQLLFEGVHALRCPLVVLSGRGVLLSLPLPPRGEAHEVADVQPGDCLAS